MEDFPGIFIIHDGMVNSLLIGKALSGIHFRISYVMTGGAVHQNGELTMSHNGTDVVVDNEYGGINPTHKMEISGKVLDGNIMLNFDTIEGVGNDLTFKYTIENKQ
jgi:hypothetical protein